MPTDRTHDISLINYHVKDLASFGDCLTEAAKAVFPRLLLSWEEDNLGVAKEVLELQDVFQQIYLYEVEQWIIPSSHSYKALRKRISRFLDDFEDKESLLIVYYGGHGFMNDDRQCIWSCTDTANSSTVQWSGLQSLLEHAESDVLILLDCCAAASSISGAGSGVTEVIAACGFETWTPGVGDHSFTRSLIDELRYWGQGRTLSVAMLHNKVLSRLKYWKPRFGTTGEHEHRKTPIYIVLANEGKQRSIALIPLSPAKSPVVELTAAPFPNSSSSDTSMESQMDIQGNAQNSSLSSLDQIWPDLEFHCPKVLMSIALEEDQVLHTADWVDWLRSVPAMVQYAHVEGIFKSGSTMMLLSIPVAIWDLLPKNPAMMFIAFIHSQNLLRSSLPTWVAPWDAVKENTTTLPRMDDLIGDSWDAVEKKTMVFSGVKDPEGDLSQLQNVQKFEKEESDTRTSLMTRDIIESDSENEADEFLGVPPFQTSIKPLSDAASRHQVDDVEVSTLREVETAKQAKFKDIDVEKWLSQTHSDDGFGDPPQDPVQWSAGERISSAGALLLTRANLEKLVTRRANSPRPGSEMLISDGSRGETDQIASFANSPPFSTVMHNPVNEWPGAVNWWPGYAVPGVYDGLPDQPPLYRARPWQGPLYNSSHPGVKLQPETSDAAIMRYRKRTEDVENVSHAATWGSRHTSEDDLHGLFHGFDFGERSHDSFLQRLSAKPIQPLATFGDTSWSMSGPLSSSNKAMGASADLQSAPKLESRYSSNETSVGDPQARPAFLYPSPFMSQ